jgi:phage-related protein
VAVVGTATVQVEANLDGVRDDIKRQLDEALTALNDSLKVKIKVELDTTGLSTRLDEVARDRTVKVEADTAVANAKLEATKLKAEEAARNRTAKIDVDKKDAEDGLVDLGFILDKLGLEATAFGNATTAKFGLIAVGVESAVAAIGEAFASLPALIGGAVVGIGTIALGFDGIKAAAQSIAPEFDNLRESIANTFERGLTPVFQNIASVLFPTLKSGLNDVASALVGVARNFADALTSASGLANIRTLIDNTKAGLDAFGPVIRTVMDTFLQMAAVGSSVFVPMAKMLQDVTSQFQQMIQASIQTGTFQKALDGLVGVLGALGNGINKLLGFAIQLGASLGGPLADALNAIFDLIDPLTPLAESLGKVLLDIVKTIAQTLLPVLSSMTPAFETLVNSLGQLLIPIIKTLGPPLAQLVNGFLQLLTALEPLYGPTSLTATAMQGLGTVMEGIAPLFDAIGSALGKVVDGLNNALSPVIPIVAQMFTDLANIVAPLIVNLGDAAGTILESLEPSLKELATAVDNMVVAAGPLVRVIGDFVTQLAEALAPVLPVIIDALREVVDNITALIDPVTSVAEFLLPPLIAVIKALVDVFGFLGPLIGPVVTGLLAMKGVEILSGMLGTFRVALLGIADGIEAIGTKIPALAGAAGAASNAVGGVANGVGALAAAAGPAAAVIGFMVVEIALWNDAQKKAAELQLALGKALDQGGAAASAATQYMQKFNTISANLPDAIENISFLGHTIGDLLPTTENAKKALDDYKKSLDPLGKAAFEVQQAQAALNVDVDKYGPTSGAAIASSQRLRDAQEELARKQDAVKLATEGVNGALKEQLTVQESITDSQLGASSAFLNAEGSIASYAASLTDANQTALDHSQAENAMEQSILSAAEAAGKAASDALGPNASAADKATAYTDAEKDAFNRLTTEAGGVPPGLQAMADTLNQATTPALDTTSSAATGTASSLDTTSSAATGLSKHFSGTKDDAKTLGTDGFQWLANVPILGDLLGSLGLLDTHLTGPTHDALSGTKKDAQDTGNDGFSWLANVPILGDLLGGLGILDTHLNGATHDAFSGTKKDAQDAGNDGFSWLANVPILGDLLGALTGLDTHLNGATHDAFSGTKKDAQDAGNNGFSWLANVPILGDLLGALTGLDTHLNGPTNTALDNAKTKAKDTGDNGFSWLANVPILGDLLGALGTLDGNLNGPTNAALDGAKTKARDTGDNGFSWLSNIPILGTLIPGLTSLQGNLNGPTNSALDGTKKQAQDTGNNGFSWLSSIPILGSLIPGLNTLQGNLNGPTNTALRGTGSQAVTTGGQVDGLGRSVNSLPPGHNTNITADTNPAKSTIGAFLQKLGGLPLVSSFMNIASTIAGFLAANGAIVQMAEGGMMAADVATIVAPNTWRVIGDRAIGDEAFIPINGEPRSRSILTETAKRMGFGLVPMADGGLIDQFTVQSDVAQQFLDSYQSAANAKSQEAQAAAAASAAASTAGIVANGTNMAIVQQHAAAYGWDTGLEWTDLVNLVNRESGFRNTAQNPTSTAYGMFQFLDSTWASYGPKTSDPNLQAAYGLQYIRNRYGDPIGAWNHEVSAGWYDEGGWLRPGMNFARNDTGHGEMVFPEDRLRQIIHQIWDNDDDDRWSRRFRHAFGHRDEHHERPPVVIPPPPPPPTPPQPTTSIPVTVSTPQGDLGTAFRVALSQFAPELSQAISAGAATQIVAAGTALLSSPERMAALNASIADALGEPVASMATRVQDVISSALPTARAEGGTVDPTMGAAGTLKSAQSTVSSSSTVSHTTPVNIHPGAFQVNVNGNADSVTVSQLQRCLKDWNDELLHQVRGRR